MNMMFLRLPRLSSIRKSACNGVDYISNLLGRFMHLLLLSLTFVPLRATPLSSFLLHSIPSSISVSALAMIILVPPGPASNLVVIRLFHKLS